MLIIVYIIYLVPGEVRNVKHFTNSDGSVTITWETPFAEGGPDPIYVIKYGNKLEKTAKKTFKIGTGTQDTSYKVKVTSHLYIFL